MKAKRVKESLNEWSKDMPADYKLDQYEKWKEFEEEYPHNAPLHNRYIVVNTIDRMGYYNMELSELWTPELISEFTKALRSRKIKFVVSHGYVKIFNEDKNPEKTEDIIDLIEDFDPIGEAYGTDSKIFGHEEESSETGEDDSIPFHPRHN